MSAATKNIAKTAMRIVTSAVRLSLSFSIFVFAASVVDVVVVVGTGVVVVVDVVGSVGGSIVDPSIYVLFCLMITLISGCGLLVDGCGLGNGEPFENGSGGTFGSEWISGRTGNELGFGSKLLLICGPFVGIIRTRI